MALQKVGAPEAPTAEQRAIAAAAKTPVMKTTCPGNDVVTRPEHYRQGGMETIDILKAKLSPEAFKGFCIGNVIKYVTRAEYKNGIEDYKKAKQYLDFLIGTAEGK